MSSAVSETSTWEAAVIGPDGADLRTAASVRTGLQDLANRTKWLRGNLVDIQMATPTGSGVNYTGSSWVNLSETDPFRLQFANVKAGDKIALFAQSVMATVDSVDPIFRFGNTTGPVVCVGTPVTVSAANTLFTVIGGHTVGADASSLDIYLQINPDSAASGVNVDGGSTFLLGAVCRATE